jgi:pyruvate dehydrogenase E1 component alpha subunit
MSDPAKYRTKEEVDEVKTTRDPIDHVKTMLEQAGVKEDELKAVDNEVKTIVMAAVEFAQTSPEPDPSEMYTDVYLEA